MMRTVHASSETLRRPTGSTSVPDLRLGSLAQSTSWSIKEQLVIETDAQREAFVDALIRQANVGRSSSTETFSPIFHNTTAARLGGVVDLLDEAIAMYQIQEESDLEDAIGMPFPATVPASWVAEISSMGLLKV